MPSSGDPAKVAAARAAVARIGSERRIALGTGSTAAEAVRALAERFPGGAGFDFVASSRATEELARSLHLPVRALREDDRFEMMIDGADEVAPTLDLTKGGGGALFREKFLATLSEELVILVDPSKLVERLGSRHPIPIEVVPFARPVLARSLSEVGYSVRLRAAPDGQPFRSDNGNEILDLTPASPLEDPARTEAELRARVGVVGTGLFIGLADRVLIGRSDGPVEERVRSPARERRR